MTTNCSQCGAALNGDSNCPSCGASAQQAPQHQQTSSVSIKSRMVATLLCFFLGGLGVHRFYAGKIGTGILWLFTGGALGIGWLVDFIMIVAGSFKDSDGYVISNWNT
jgi:TM2 domain-containing membrane protein YozV